MFFCFDAVTHVGDVGKLARFNGNRLCCWRKCDVDKGFVDGADGRDDIWCSVDEKFVEKNTIEDDDDAKSEEKKENELEKRHCLNVAVDENAVQSTKEKGEREEFMGGFPDVIGEANVIGEDDTDGEDGEADDAKDLCYFADREEELECG